MKKRIISIVAILIVTTTISVVAMSKASPPHETIVHPNAHNLVKNNVRRYSDRYEIDGYAFMFSYNPNKCGSYNSTYYEDGWGRWNDKNPQKLNHTLYNPNPNAVNERIVGDACEWGFKCTSNVWNSSLSHWHGKDPENRKVDYARKFKATYTRAKTIPSHNNSWIYGAKYQNGKDFWTKPNAKLRLKLGGYQTYEGNKIQLDDWIKEARIVLSNKKERASMQIFSNKTGNYLTQISSLDLSYNDWTNSTDWKYIYANTNVTPKIDNEDYLVEVAYLSQNGYWSNGSGYQNTGYYIKTDGVEPIYNDITKDDEDIERAKVNVSQLKDIRGVNSQGSGLKTNGTILRVYNPNNKAQFIDIKPNVSVNSPQSVYDLEFEISYDNISFLKDYYGDYVADFISEDNVGNQKVTQVALNRVDPTPIDSDLEVIKYKYQDGNIFWVNAVEEFEVKSLGYSSSKYPNYPTETNLKIGNILLTSTTTTTTMSNDNYIAMSKKYIASNILQNGKKGIEANHILKGNKKANNQKYALSSYTRTNYKGKWFNSTEYNSGLYVAVDSEAPSGKVTSNYNNETLDLSIKVDNVVEEGSGVKNIYAITYAENDPTNKKQMNLTLNGNSYNLTFNTYNEFANANKIVIEIFAEDNVDNIKLLEKTEVNTFNIKANIERVLSPNTPIFKEGEKGILKINLFGGVDKVKITFPKELTDLDSTLNKEYVLDPKKTDSLNVEFFVPIGCKESSYRVKVVGYKNGEEKIVYPPFETKGSILKEIRSRIRIKK